MTPKTMYVVTPDSEDETLKITKRDDVSQEKQKRNLKAGNSETMLHIGNPEAGKPETENTDAVESGTENLQIAKRDDVQPEGGNLQIAAAGEAKPNVEEPKVVKHRSKLLKFLKFQKPKDMPAPAFKFPPLAISST